MTIPADERSELTAREAAEAYAKEPWPEPDEWGGSRGEVFAKQQDYAQHWKSAVRNAEIFRNNRSSIQCGENTRR